MKMAEISDHRQHSRLIQIIYSVAFLDLFSVSMITTCLATYLKDELNMSATMAGFVGSVYGFVQFFSSPVVGCWSDYYGYKRILSLCLFACVPAYIFLSSEVWLFVIFSRIVAGSFKHTQTLTRTYLATFASDSEKMKAYGRLNAMGNVGFVVGPAVEAWLLDNYGYSAVFYCTALTFLINGILVSCFLPSLATSKTTDTQKVDKSPGFQLQSFFTEFCTAIEKVDWSKQWDLMLTRFLLSFVVLLYRSSYGWMMQEKFKIDPATIGYITSYQGVVGFFGSICTNYVAILYVGDTVRLYEHVILLMFVALLGLIFSTSFYSYLFFLTPFCISTSVMRVVTLELTTERSSKKDIGLILGVSASSVSFARALSPAMGGVLHDWHRDLAAIFCIAIVIGSWAVTIIYTRLISYGEDMDITVKHKRQ